MPKAKKAPSTKKSSTSAKKTSTSKKKSTTVKAKKTTKKPAAKKSSAVSKAKSTDATNLDGEALELLNETGRRKQSIKPPVERRKRRRQIDPTTCERDYNDNEIEFMQAMDDYKRQSGRMFPTCSEILEVLEKIGYRKVAEAAELMFDPNEDKKVVEEESLETRFEDEEEDDE